MYFVSIQQMASPEQGGVDKVCRSKTGVLLLSHAAKVREIKNTHKGVTVCESHSEVATVICYLRIMTHLSCL